MSNSIIIKGAREHNLKNLDVEIPRDKLVVMTGLRMAGRFVQLHEAMPG